jgi:hypothetical protein
MPSTSAADFTFFAAAPAASDADAVYVVGNHLGALCGPLSAAGNFLRRRALLFDCRGNRGGNSVHLADDSANSLDRLDSLQGNFLNRRDLSRYLFGGICGLAGQRLDLGCNHCKPPAGLPRPRCLDGRIQCQLVRLRSNVVDQANHFANTACRCRKPLDRIVGLPGLIDGAAGDIRERV